jgi:hypothetical protein
MAGDIDNLHDPEDLSEVMDFSSYDLSTTIRLIVLSGESRRIDVRKGSRNGAIFIREGEIWRVVSDKFDGDEAFFDILSWPKADHSDVQQVDPPEKNVRIPTNVFMDLLKNGNAIPEY